MEQVAGDGPKQGGQGVGIALGGAGCYANSPHAGMYHTLPVAASPVASEDTSAECQAELIVATAL